MQACCNHLPSISQMRFADVSASLLQLDLPTGEGMQQCFDRLGPVDAVINCAAISSPAACEQELDTARCVQCKSPAYWPGTKLLIVPWSISKLVVACRALNVPTKLLDALDLHKLMHQRDPLLIQLSTDQACLSHGRSGLCTKH